MNKFYEALSEVIAEFCVENEEKGRWVTIKGTHVFIKDGETYEDAIEKLEAKKKTPQQKKTETRETKTYKELSENSEAFKQMAEHTKNLSEAETDALKVYVWERDTYLGINGLLRGDTTAYEEKTKQKITPEIQAKLEEHIKEIDKAMENSIIPEDIILYRGGIDASIGKIFKDEKLQEELQDILSKNKYISRSSIE